MKRVLFAIVAGALISSAWGCRECGYCQYPNGMTGSTVCQTTSALAAPEDLVEGVGDYIIAQDNCSTNGGSWVTIEQ
jgi:hypothetical protein